MSHVPGELIGHVNRLQGIPLFTYFRLEQGPISFIYHPSALRASRKQIDAFTAKRGLPIVLYRPWVHRRWDAECLIREFESRSSVAASDPRSVIDGLRGEIQKGRRSGKPKPAPEVLDRLERKYTKMAKDRAK
jgi:hypothetical protein